jgi:Icc-related predicted phosphoesterase
MPAADTERTGRIRVAAAGDVHCRESHREEIVRAFAGLAGNAEIALLAGDLTSNGEVSEAEILAEACGPLELPVIAVLGNHDWHRGEQDRIAAVLGEAGVIVLDREVRVVEVERTEIGVVGAKGFIGGFPGSHLTDYGEPALRMAYAETTAEVKGIARGLKEISTLPIRIVLLHYAPIEETLKGEPPGIWTYLGADRLAGPIREHEPDLVLHGHAHHGSLEGSIGNVPVYNVSAPLMGGEFWVLELNVERQPAPPVH